MAAVEESFESRLAHNEGIFRSINERIEANALPRAIESPVAFLCECARLRCSDVIEVTIPVYERTRANPRRFLIVPGHELPEVEDVVEATDAYAVVEKSGEAGRAAAEDTSLRHGD